MNILKIKMMKSIQEKLRAHEKFASEVKSMRHLQKKYFQTRNTEVLQQAKVQEKKVDKLLVDLFPKDQLLGKDW